MRFRQLRPVGERALVPPLTDLLAGSYRQRSTVTLTDLADSLRASDARLQGFDFLWLDSATAALAVVLRAAARAKGVSQPEVIIPAFACPDIVAAAVHAGVRPVLSDFLPDSAQLDPGKVEAARTSRTVAVVSVRLLGLPGNTAAVRQALHSDCPTLIEDCAHVSPEDVFDTDADALVLSFGRGKPVSFRRGGLLLTARRTLVKVPDALITRDTDGPARRRPEIQSHHRAQALCHWLKVALYNRSISPGAYWFLTRACGIPVDSVSYRPLREVRNLPDYLTAVLPAALAREFSNSDELANTYDRMLRTIAGPWFDPVWRRSNHSREGGEGRPRLWRYPLLLTTGDLREQLFNLLWRRGLGPSRLYRQTLSEMPGTASYVRTLAHPHARSFAARLLTLPLHSDVTAKDAANIEDCVRLFAAEVSHRICRSDQAVVGLEA
jgi:dTDP-4-amino-4,6-dideoxygalactose transaminase